MENSFFMRKIQTLFLLIFIIGLMSCESSNNPLNKIMASDAIEISRIRENLDRHEVQILYTQIDRDENGKPLFKEYSYQLDANNYFYPASTAKMPVAILALQRINELKSEGQKVDKLAPFSIFEKDTDKVIVEVDSTEENLNPTIAHMIKKIFLVSDNDAYNYLFEFLGRDYVNQELRKKSLGPAHLNHKFQVGADNKNMNPMSFNMSDTYTVIEGTVSNVDKHSYPLNRMIKGIGYTDNEGNLTEEPMDFSEKNYFSIQSLNHILKAVIFPEEFEEESRFNLTDEDYDFLRFWMSRTALESEYPNYNDGEHYDSYVKFFMFGDNKDPMPKHIRIYNKVGYAYGYLTDVAYIKDSKENVEFMLTATVHVNENQIYNDGNYEYDSLGIPFLAELGRQVYNLELNRK